MMERRQSTTITMLVLAALCVFGLFFGLRALTSDLPGGGILNEAPVCEPRTVTPGSQIAPAEVAVSVYNASNRNGLAGKTMKTLIERGFVAADSGNVRTKKVVAVEIWSTEPDNPAVQLVKAQFGPNTKVVRPRKDIGAGVVVVVGNDFAGLAKKFPETMEVKARATICSPRDPTA